MSRNPVHGHFVWHELLTNDTAGARAFYPSFTGWAIDKMTMGEDTYYLWKRGDVMAGGCMTLPAQAREMGAPPHWMGYVGVTNADETFAQAIGLGATPCVPPTDIPGIGRFACLADPLGAAISILQPANSSEPPPPAEVGEFSWNELDTDDPQAAFAFYNALFGWEKQVEHDMGPMGTYAIFGAGGRTIGAMFKRPAEIPMSAWCYYVQVQSAHDAAAAICAHGGTVVNGPMEVPGGDWVAQFVDPQGAFGAIHAAKPAGG